MTHTLSGLTILIVEDEMMVLMTIESMLQDLGCSTMYAAATVDQAIALIGTYQFDAAMLDVNLDGITSFAVADVLSAKAIPFIFSTGYSELRCSSGHSHRPVINKPFNVGRLGTAMQRLLSA